MTLRNRYLLLGLSGALVVAVAIVVAGSLGQHAGGATTSQQSPAPGHPAVNGDGSGTGASTQQSIAELQTVSKQDPSDASVLLQLGSAYFLAERYTQAQKTFRQVLRLEPGDATATVRLAMVWQAEGDTQRAMDAIQGVLRTRPNDQEAHYSLAIVYFSLERVQDARTEWARAAAIDPTSSIGRRSQNFVDLIDGKQSGD